MANPAAFPPLPLRTNCSPGRERRNEEEEEYGLFNDIVGSFFPLLIKLGDGRGS